MNIQIYISSFIHHKALLIFHGSANKCKEEVKVHFNKTFKTFVNNSLLLSTLSSFAKLLSLVLQSDYLMWAHFSRAGGNLFLCPFYGSHKKIHFNFISFILISTLIFEVQRSFVIELKSRNGWSHSSTQFFFVQVKQWKLFTLFFSPLDQTFFFLQTSD